MKFIDKSKEILADIEWRKKKAITENALILEREISLRTPVDTGRLRASISHVAPLSKSPEEQSHFILEGESIDKEAYVGTNVSYAPYVEYGTKHQKAQSYMRMGYDAAKPKMDKNMERNMKI